MNQYFNIKGIGILGLCSLLGLSSCMKDLDREPTNTDTAKTVFNTPEGTKKALAKVYGAFALTGNEGPAGQGDVAGIDEGASDFLRNYFNLQELCTDEAICAWADDGVPDIHNMNWSSSNPFVKGLYYRSLYQIKLATDFLVQTQGKASDPEVKVYRAEARFLRAFQYWVMMDIFGNPPFINEELGTGKVYPKQIMRKDLFAFLIKEIKEFEPDLKAAKRNEYGRVDQAAAWALLSRIYLNAEVYARENHYKEAAEYAEKVINSGYTPVAKYGNLFLADNNLNNSETILSINYDGIHSKNYGGSTFLINSSSSADAITVHKQKMGINGGWGGNRATSALEALFDKSKDTRYMMAYKDKEIKKASEFMQGVFVYKFRNVTSKEENGQNSTFTDTDYPLFRVAEMYLNYAEAAARGGADQAKGLSYINKIRERAYGNASGNFSTLKLDDVLAERGRELYWECMRRTDLIRFGKFTSGSYLWPWKGGVKDGRGVSEHYSIYPLPSDDVQANSKNLKQNPNY